MNKNKVICIDIETKIRQYAKSKRIQPERFAEFREGILKGLGVLKLRTDIVEERKYIQITNRKETKEVLQWKNKKEYSPMDMFE